MPPLPLVTALITGGYGGCSCGVEVTMTVYAHGHLAEKAAALAQLGTAVAGALPSAVAVTSPADDHTHR